MAVAILRNGNRMLIQRNQRSAYMGSDLQLFRHIKSAYVLVTPSWCHEKQYSLYSALGQPRHREGK